MVHATERIFRRKALERLSSPEQLDRLVDIGARRPWIPLGSAVLAIVFAVGWASIATIPVEVEGCGVLVRGDLADRLPPELGAGTSGRPGTEHLCIAFFSIAGGKRLAPSMPALVTPEGSARERFGSLVAVVATVAPAAIGAETAAALARHSDVFGGIPLAEQPVAATLRLDPATAARLAISKTAAAGATIDLAAGTPVSVRVVIEERRAISYLFQALMGPGGR